MRPLRRSAPVLFVARCLVAANICVGSLAWAGDKQEADRQFAQGRALMHKGELDQAAAAFQRSIDAEPSVGALVNFARYRELQGTTATAVTLYRHAARMADTQSQPERARAARKLAAALEPKLSHVTVTAAHPTKGLRIRVAGKDLETISMGKPVPVDPGEIRIEATAPDHQSWTTSVTVAADGDAQQVEVPRLEPAEPASPTPGGEGPTPIAPPAGSTATHGPDDAPGSWSGQHTAALVVGGVGVVGVVLGGVFGGLAGSQWDEALSYCNDEDTSDCSDEAGPLSNDATTSATVSTVGFVVGGAALATGVILWLTAPSGDEHSTQTAWRLAPTLGPGIAAASLQRSF